MEQLDHDLDKDDDLDDASGARGPLKLWLRLLSSATLIETELSRRLRAHFDISLARFDFMAQLARAPDGMTMSQLSQRLMVTGGNITGLTDRLEREGLAQRRPHPSDRRSQVIAFTNKGRRNFERMAEVHAGWVNELIGDLDEAEYGALMRSLSSLKETVQAKLHDGSE